MAATRELILFDLDGTLMDSAPGILESVQYAYVTLGLECPDLETLRTFVGPPLHASAVRHGVPADMVDEFLAAYRVAFVDGGMLNNSVYDGVRSVLKELQLAGKRMAIATSKPEIFARQICRHFDLDQHFEFIAGATLDTSRSSKSLVVAHALKNLAESEQGLPAVGQMVMVGDREHDVLGAREHGIDTIGVTWGYAQPGELVEAGASALVEEPRQLLDVLLTA
ncbi:HAD hydrolase-like protein [Timonella sp. A28]|uniref:HAD hydrolase-like protein n=1 Tax=Timonella sp. A28 TaxID=3442640 RepID=UPI003EB8F6C4